MRITKSLIGLSMLFTTASALCDDFLPPGSDFDNVFWDNKLTDKPAKMGVGSFFFVTRVMQNEEVKAAYASLMKLGRIGSVTVQKVQLSEQKEKTDRFVINAYKPQMGWGTQAIAASLTIDETPDHSSTGGGAPVQYKYEISLVSK